MKVLSLQNISIGKQILFLPLIALSGLLVILVVQYMSMISQSKIADRSSNQLVLRRNIRNFQEQMTQLRLSEKDFILRHSVDATRNHRDAMREIFRTLENIKSVKKTHGFNKELVNIWQAKLARYLDVYQDAARELEAMGFSENTGLRGSMRTAIHIVERTVKNKEPSLMRDMLEMRRHEKDFIIRRDEKFYSQWKQSVPVFMTNVENSNLSSVERIAIKLSLTVYVDSFQHLVKLTRDSVLDGYTADKISVEVLKSIKISSSILSSLANTRLEQNYSDHYKSFTHLASLTMLIFVSVAAAGGIIGYHLRTNLAQLTDSMIKLAKGDTDIRIPATSFRNEIGQMANALRIFRDTEKAKVWGEINLKISQEHTEHIIESLNESLFEVDAHGIITRANHASANLLGIKAENLVGQKLVDLFEPKSKKTRKLEQELAQLLFVQTQLDTMKITSSNQVAALMNNAQVPMFLVEKDGTIAQANIAATGMLGYDITELNGQNIDILIPKKTRKNHHKHVSSTFKQQTARHMLDGKGLMAEHKDGHKIEVSIGLAPFEIAGQAYMLCICACQEEGFKQTAVNKLAVSGLFNGISIDPEVAIFATANGRGLLREDKIITANGSAVPVEISGALVANTVGNPSGAIVTIHDITTRKEKARKILQFKRVLDEGSDQIFMFWPNSYKLFYLNKTACQLTGWDAEEYSEKTVMDFNPDFDPNEFGINAKPLISGEQDQMIYERTERRDGCPVEVSIEYVPANQASKAYFVAVVRDITERKVAETAKSEFLSTVSHELRTPLTSIKGALGIINSGIVCDLNDKLKNLVSIALTNSDRLIGLINDILDIEKIASGKMDFAIEQMDISELIHEAINANEGYAKTCGVVFKNKGVHKQVLVKGDGQRLMQVMSNLMSNAAKFSEKGQEIEISVKCRNNKVRVQVKDNGSGIPKAAQATIFDRFTQADSSDQRQKGGTGLGLSIAKMIVEAHGGEIGFKSVEGKGTAFYFDLDLVESTVLGSVTEEGLNKDQSIPDARIASNTPTERQENIVELHDRVK